MSNASIHSRIDFARGDALGIAMPAHPEALLQGGAELLTQLLHGYGSLPAGNRVARITGTRPCPGGSTGRKLFLSVQHERANTNLDTELFVKFSRDFDDAIRDRQRLEMESEVRLAALSRHPAFPITVPRTWFGDYQSATGTGLLITSVVDFGSGGIEPQHRKCMDHELQDPLEYYRAILTALARLAAAHKSGRLSPALERTFPFDRERAVADDRIPFDRAGVQAELAKLRQLAGAAPQLFPAQLIEPSFIDGLEGELLHILQHELAIKRFLHADDDYIALCHWNANIDNAWFWRGAGGALQCGLFDWGRVRQLNLAYALWGCLCAAPRALWDRHLDELLALFVAELCAGGGPVLDVERLKLHLWAYVSMIGLAGLIVAPDRILLRLPQAVHATGPRDPVFEQNPSARNFLHIYTNFLDIWHARKPGALLAGVLCG